MAESHNVNWGVHEERFKSSGSNTCFDAITYMDEDIQDFLKEDPHNFIIEIAGSIKCSNKKLFSRLKTGNGQLVYLCNSVQTAYNITRDMLVDETPYIRLETLLGLDFPILCSYYNLVEVIINSDDQLFITSPGKDSDGNEIKSISTVSLSIYKNKASVVSGAHCQAGGDYSIYNIYSLLEPEITEKLLRGDAVPTRSVEEQSIDSLRQDIDKKLDIDPSEIVDVYFPEGWYETIFYDKIPDFSYLETPKNWWNMKDGMDNYKLEYNIQEGEEKHILTFLFILWVHHRHNVTIDGIRETLERQIRGLSTEYIEYFIKTLEETVYPFSETEQYFVLTPAQFIGSEEDSDSSFSSLDLSEIGEADTSDVSQEVEILMSQIEDSLTQKEKERNQMLRDSGITVKHVPIRTPFTPPVDYPEQKLYIECFDFYKQDPTGSLGFDSNSMDNLLKIIFSNCDYKEHNQSLEESPGYSRKYYVLVRIDDSPIPVTTYLFLAKSWEGWNEQVGTDGQFLLKYEQFLLETPWSGDDLPNGASAKFDKIEILGHENDSRERDVLLLDGIRVIDPMEAPPGLLTSELKITEKSLITMGIYFVKETRESVEPLIPRRLDFGESGSESGESGSQSSESGSQSSEISIQSSDIGSQSGESSLDLSSIGEPVFFTHTTPSGHVYRINQETNYAYEEREDGSLIYAGRYDPTSESLYLTVTVTEDTLKNPVNYKNKDYVLTNHSEYSNLLWNWYYPHSYFIEYIDTVDFIEGATNPFIENYEAFVFIMDNLDDIYNSLIMNPINDESEFPDNYRQLMDDFKNFETKLFNTTNPEIDFPLALEDLFANQEVALP